MRTRAACLGIVLAFAAAGLAPMAAAAPTPLIAIDDVAVIEGDAGTVSLVFHLTQDRRAKSSVRYATVGGTATSPQDYAAKSGLVRFNGPHLSRTVTINVVGDTTDEANETFTLKLSSPRGATIADDVGVGTITDDDDPPTVDAAATVSVPEGNAGDHAFASIAVTLSEASGRDVSVHYDTSDGTATTADSDYVAESGDVEFSPGQTTKAIVVEVVGDDAVELDETFHVDLSAPVHADLGNANSIVTIVNNDPIPPGAAIFTVSGDSVREGKKGTTTLLTFTITRSGETTTAADVDVDTADGTAIAPTDYTAVTGNVAFLANETTKTVDVTVKGDGSLEHNETLFLNISNPSLGDAIQTGQATGTIRNDDTRTTVLVAKRPHRIRVHGRLSPARPGKRMVVRLYRRRNGVWALVKVAHPLLFGTADRNGDGFGDSTYSVWMRRRAAGSCRVVARFPGDTGFAPSKATRNFRC